MPAREPGLRPRWIFPVSCYLFVTLGIPLLRGGAERLDFRQHATWVLLETLGVVGVFLAVRRVARARVRRY